MGTLAEIAWASLSYPEAHGVDKKHIISDCIGSCFLCGSKIDSACCYSKSAIITETFTGLDQARSPKSNVVCMACSWSLKAVLNDRKKDGVSATGKEKRAPWMRCFSVYADESGRCDFWTKADRDLIISRIREKTNGKPSHQWGLALADSGQKQLIWRTPINQGGSSTFTIRLEEKIITTTIGALNEAIAAIEGLRAVFTIAEIESGNYESRRVMVFGVDRWQSVESLISPIRQSGLFELALWLSVASPKEGGNGSQASDCKFDRDVAAGLAERSGPEDPMGPDRISPKGQRGKQRELGENPRGHQSKIEAGSESMGGDASGIQLGFGW